MFFKPADGTDGLSMSHPWNLDNTSVRWSVRLRQVPSAWSKGRQETAKSKSTDGVETDTDGVADGVPTEFMSRPVTGSCAQISTGYLGPGGRHEVGTVQR